MTNNKQQTAVEQFAIALYEKFKLEGNGKELNDLVEQAKEMHKKEHFNTWWHSISENEPITFEQYYKQTFGGGEQ